MIALLAALVLSQTPAPLVTPPEATATPALIAVPATQNEPAEVKLFSEFVARHLLSVNMTQYSFEMRQRERVYRLQDDDFVGAFALVPEALTMAQVAHDDFVTGMRLEIIGLVVVSAALVATVIGPLATGVLLPLLIAGLVGAGVGLVLSLVALPFLISAQTRFFAAIASYNRGLLDLRPPAPVSAILPGEGGLVLALP